LPKNYKVYAVCVDCREVHYLGLSHLGKVAEMVTMSSWAVKEFSNQLPMTESYWKATIADAMKFAKEHSDKKHKVIIAYEGRGKVIVGIAPISIEKTNKGDFVD